MNVNFNRSWVVINFIIFIVFVKLVFSYVMIKIIIISWILNETMIGALMMNFKRRGLYFKKGWEEIVKQICSLKLYRIFKTINSKNSWKKSSDPFSSLTSDTKRFHRQYQSCIFHILYTIWYFVRSERCISTFKLYEDYGATIDSPILRFLWKERKMIPSYKLTTRSSRIFELLLLMKFFSRIIIIYRETYNYTMIFQLILLNSPNKVVHFIKWMQMFIKKYQHV